MSAKITPIRRSISRAATSVLVAFVTLFAVGCSDAANSPSAELTGRVVIKGSNTFGEELAPRLIAEYRRMRPNVTVDLESKGSGSGFAALLAGDCDIASASRAANKDEQAAFAARGIQIEEHLIGYYGVAVVVHAANPVNSLSKDQVADIFSGRTTNWKTVGGTDAAIHVLIRDPVAGTHLGFRELAMKGLPYVPSAKTLTSYTELENAVRGDAAAIAYSSMHLAATPGVKTVRIGQTEPNAISVNEGWYPYARTLYLCTNKAKTSPAARDFVAFVQRKPGQDIIDNAGFVRRFEKSLRSTLPD